MIHLIPIILIAALFTMVQTPSKKDGEPGIIYIGVLETKYSDWPNELSDRMEKTSEKKILRPLFYSENDQWKSFASSTTLPASYPTRSHWHIAFDGSSLGSFDSEIARMRFPDCNWCWQRDAYHQVHKKELPTIGVPEPQFASWSGNEYRPLISVSESHFSDPENWKPFEPDYKTGDLIYPVANAYIMTIDPEVENTSREELHFLKSYQSKGGDQLLHLSMQLAADEHNVLNYEFWLFKSKDGKIKCLDDEFNKAHNQDEFSDDDIAMCTLIDAGDYNGDGKSEVIFWTSRYNRDGYVMFFDDFDRMIDFTWQYH